MRAVSLRPSSLLVQLVNNTHPVSSQEDSAARLPHEPPDFSA